MSEQSGSDSAGRTPRPFALDRDAVRAFAFDSLEAGGGPSGRLLNGRVVAVLASGLEHSANHLATGLSVIPAGVETEEHRHPADEVAYIIEGEGINTLGGEEFRVGPGSIVFVPSDVPHKLKVTSEQTLISLWVYAPTGSESRWLESQSFAEPADPER